MECKQDGGEGSFKIKEGVYLDKTSSTCNTVDHELEDEIRQLVMPKESLESSCPICQERLFVAPVVTSCGHTFCWPCIVRQHRGQHVGRYKCATCKDIFASVVANFAIPGIR